LLRLPNPINPSMPVLNNQTAAGTGTGDATPTSVQLLISVL
jgi:hypothetical protein